MLVLWEVEQPSDVQSRLTGQTASVWAHAAWPFLDGLFRAKKIVISLHERHCKTENIQLRVKSHVLTKIRTIFTRL